MLSRTRSIPVALAACGLAVVTASEGDYILTAICGAFAVLALTWGHRFDPPATGSEGDSVDGGYTDGSSDGGSE